MITYCAIGSESLRFPAAHTTHSIATNTLAERHETQIFRVEDVPHVRTSFTEHGQHRARWIGWSRSLCAHLGHASIIRGRIWRRGHHGKRFYITVHPRNRNMRTSVLHRRISGSDQKSALVPNLEKHRLRKLTHHDITSLNQCQDL
jgi:hypothetical protein